MSNTPKPHQSLFAIQKEFWNQHEKTPFSPLAISFFFYLVHKLNRSWWPDTIYLTTQHCIGELKVSKSSLWRARQELVDSGVIAVDGHSGRTRSTAYSLKIGSEKSMASSSCKPVSLEETMRMLAADTDWQQIVCDMAPATAGIRSLDMLYEKLKEFYGLLKCRGISSRSVEECKEHFVNWLCSNGARPTPSKKDVVDISGNTLDDYNHPYIPY